MNDRLLTNSEAAQMLAITPKTLSKWRCEGRTLTDHGPIYQTYKPTGRFWGYRLSDVLEYINANTEPHGDTHDGDK